MKIFGFSMIKNECDIIEAFVRANLSVLDQLHIIDDGSNDNTVNIIRSLQAEGFNVHLYFHSINEAQQQSQLMTSLVKQLEHLDWDYGVMLDADEFVLDNRETFELNLQGLGQNSIGLLEWINFVPVIDPDILDNSGFCDRFRPRATESVVMSKIVIPRNITKQPFQISAGNHFALTNKNISETHRKIDSKLGHIPIRSKEQLINKAVIGSHILSTKKNRGKNETTHWDLMAEIIREKKFQIDFQSLQEFSYGFPSLPKPLDQTSLTDHPKLPPIGRLLYTDFKYNSLLANFDQLCITLRQK